VEVKGEGVRDEAQMSKMIKAGDNGSDEWYFVAPHKFTGSKREAYGGSLSFRHGFFEFNRSSNPLACAIAGSRLRCSRAVGARAATARTRNEALTFSSPPTRTALRSAGRAFPRVVLQQ
jgi:hypothetical protein